jgi:hypothetical protein
VLAGVSLIAAALFYLPFLVHAQSWAGIPFGGAGMERVYGMWDGPAYVTAAATLWDPNPENPVYGWFSAPPSDYTERFPLYPTTIRLLAPILGYWRGALIINLVASTAGTVLLYVFLRRWGPVRSAAFWLAFVAIFLPPRAFLYRYVGMSEPLFGLSLLAAAHAWKSERFALCGLAGAAAVAARPNGFLVAVGFGLLALGRGLAALRSRRWHGVGRLTPLLLMPAAFGVILLWHQHVFGDWLASVHSRGFVSPEPRMLPSLAYFGIGEEGVPLIFVFALAGVLELARRGHRDLAVLSLALYLPALFVPTDVSRYLLPIFPFVFFLAGGRLLAATPLRVAVVAAIPIVYTYAWATLLDPGYQAPFGPLYAMLP